MNLYFRLLWMLLGNIFRPKLGFMDASVLEMRVWANDLDIYGHMNNGRYLTLMDLGRMDLILRTGLGRTTGRLKWQPLVGSSHIRYRRSLKLLQRFELHTRIAGWNEKWFLIEQRFQRHGKTVARGWVKGLFYGPKGKVATRELLKAMGVDRQPPVLVGPMQKWLDGDIF